MKKATAIAAANIALVKYWGSRPGGPGVPLSPSISMTLSRCLTRCTVEPREPDAGDEVWWQRADGDLEPAAGALASGVCDHLERLRAATGTSASFTVATGNSFPSAAGLASSASGHAALAVAVLAAHGRDAGAEELSRLARLSGSGSAARSLHGGYVEWPVQAGEPEGPARQLAPAEHWDLRDLVAIVERRPKEVSSREGHRRAPTSPYFARRLELLPERLARTRRALLERDFAALAPLVEEEAIDLHLIAMSSRPPIFYWTPATLAVLAAVRRLRAQGLAVCATLDAGPNVHVLAPAEAAAEAARELAALPGVEELIVDGVGGPARLSEEHLR